MRTARRAPARARPAPWRTITRAPVSVWQMTWVSAPSSSTMITVAAIDPSGLRRSASGRRPSTTSGPLPRTASATAAGSGTEAPAKATHSVPPPRRPPSTDALDQHPLDQVHARAAEEAGHERVGRPGVEVLGRGHLLELPVAHHGDAVAHRHGLDLVVGDVERGGAEAALQLDDVGPGLHPQRGIEVGERLVHQEDQRARARWPGPGPPAGAGHPRAGPACGRAGRPARACSAASLTLVARSSLSTPRWRSGNSMFLATVRCG